MAKANLGTKRVCPETGRKFYDLEKDPIVSPYTGNEYPISFFEGEANITAPKPEAEEKAPETAEAKADTEEDAGIELEDAPEIISLEDAEDDIDDDDDDNEDIPDIPDIPDVDIDDDDDAADDDTFLEDDDEDDDLSDVIVGVEGSDDEN